LKKDSGQAGVTNIAIILAVFLVKPQMHFPYKIIVHLLMLWWVINSCPSGLSAGIIERLPQHAHTGYCVFRRHAV
jgi:hypothetical protein